MTQPILDPEFFSITNTLITNTMHMLPRGGNFSDKNIEAKVRKEVRKNILGSAKTISAIKVLNFIEEKRLEWLKNEKEITIGDLRLQFHKSPIHSDTSEQYTLEIRTQPTSETTYEWRFLKSKGTMTTYTLVEVYASTVSAKNIFVFDANSKNHSTKKTAKSYAKTYVLNLHFFSHAWLKIFMMTSNLAKSLISIFTQRAGL